MDIFFQFNSMEPEQYKLFCNMLRTNVAENLKLCHTDDQEQFIHANLDVQRNFQPVDPADLTRNESYILQRFVRIQYHLLVYLQDLLQENKPLLLSGFRWKVGKGQLLELGDAMQDFIQPTGPQSTQKFWFESLCSFLQVECPTNLNQELLKKRNRYRPSRFLEELINSYLNRCQHLK